MALHSCLFAAGDCHDFSMSVPVGRHSHRQGRYRLSGVGADINAGLSTPLKPYRPLILVSLMVRIIKLFTGWFDHGASRIWDKTPAGLLGERAAFLARAFRDRPEMTILLAPSLPNIFTDYCFPVILPFLSGARHPPGKPLPTREKIIAGISRHKSNYPDKRARLHYHSLRVDALDAYSATGSFLPPVRSMPPDAFFFKEKTRASVTEVLRLYRNRGIAFHDFPDDQGQLNVFGNSLGKFLGKGFAVVLPSYRETSRDARDFSLPEIERFHSARIVSNYWGRGRRRREGSRQKGRPG
jgi:hypothetical protein